MVKISGKRCVKLIYEETDLSTELHTHILHKNVSSFYQHAWLHTNLHIFLICDIFTWGDQCVFNLPYKIKVKNLNFKLNIQMYFKMTLP